MALYMTQSTKLGDIRNATIYGLGVFWIHNW